MSSSSTVDSARSRGWIAFLAVATWLVVHLAVACWPGLFQAWDRRASDRLFAWRSRAACASPPCRADVVHVDLAYSGLRLMAEQRVTRDDYARVLQTLHAAGARAQLFDIIFPPAERQADAELTRAAAASGRVYLGMAFHVEPPSRDPFAGPDQAVGLEAHSWDVQIDGALADVPEAFAPVAPPADLAAAARGLGFLNVIADDDGVFRRTPLLMRYQGRIFPSIGLRVACDALGVRPRDVVVTPRRQIRLRGTRDIVIPLDAAGYYRIDFVGPWEAFRHESFRKVWLAAQDPFAFDDVKQSVAGKIVVVSDIATGVADVGPAPTDSRYPLPGVHATVVHNILNAMFVREARRSEMWLAELVLLVTLTLLAWRLGSRTIGLATVGVGIAYGAVVIAAFVYLRVILEVVRPVLALGAAAFAVIGYRFVNEEKARAVLRQSFEAYLPPAVVARIVRNPSLMTSSGRRKELSILFSDIVGFTTRCDAWSPDDTRLFLNAHFETMVNVVFEHGGTVDKFIGDGLMVFFGDPEDQPDHAVRAVRCAIAMQRAVRGLPIAAGAGGSSSYELRIGINSGVVTVGNMGARRRLSYTVAGAAVNLAQRLEANARAGGILISARTNELLAGVIETVPRGAIPIKGLDQHVDVFDVPI